MNTPELSKYFASKGPSAIRMAQEKFSQRIDKDVLSINVSVGNVSLPMHPAMQERMFDLKTSKTPFAQGIVQYSQTVGFPETNQAFLHVIESSGFDTKGLYSQVTDGGSQGMELVLLGVSDAHCRPAMLIDPAYTNYLAFAARTNRKTVSLQRTLQDDGRFSLPQSEYIEKMIKEQNPSAIIVIPYDNPTGQLYTREDMIRIAELCVKHNIRMISDEAYRELHYDDSETVSIWGLTDKDVPGIQGRRISIETASKVWNGCGLRIGALITDNKEFHQQSVAEQNANLCANTIGQYIFGSLAHVPTEQLKEWYKSQRTYYGSMLQKLSDDLQASLPGVIVSSPDASIYSVIDVKNIAKPGFDAKDFSLFCAEKGVVNIEGKKYTVLVSPMSGFYRVGAGETNPGTTQMRISFVETPDKMEMVPKLFAQLFKDYEAQR